MLDIKTGLAHNVGMLKAIKRRDVPKTKETSFETLRHAFVVGRPSPVEHTILSGVAAAQAELTRLESVIATRGLQARCQVALVVASTDAGRAGKLYPMDHSPAHAAKVIENIAGLSEPRIIGLVYAIVDPATSDYEFWSKSFVRGRAAAKILDLAVADGLRRLHGEPGDYSA